MTELDEKYLKSENYVNREMSWLEFDFRILGEARDKAIPLFERLKFLSITSSNLDEFFMVRVASLKDMVHAKYKKTDIAGLRAAQQLELIGGKTHELVNLKAIDLDGFGVYWKNDPRRFVRRGRPIKKDAFGGQS